MMDADGLFTNGVHQAVRPLNFFFFVIDELVINNYN